jgi:hypothetical protein
MDVRQWFDHDIPEPDVPKTWIRIVLRKRIKTDHLPLERRLVWLGTQPASTAQTRQVTLTLQGRFANTVIQLPHAQGQWFQTVIKQATPRKKKSTPYPWIRDIQASFPGTAEDFAAFLESPSWRKTRTAGLLLV